MIGGPHESGVSVKWDGGHPAQVSSGSYGRGWHATYRRNAYLYLNINYVFKYSYQIETHKIKYGCIVFLPKSKFVKKKKKQMVSTNVAHA